MKSFFFNNRMCGNLEVIKEILILLKYKRYSFLNLIEKEKDLQKKKIHYMW